MPAGPDRRARRRHQGARSRWPTATASRPSRGPTCCATAKRRGMRAPVLAVGDGALGFWGALREVFPATREQRCWFHKIANVPRRAARSPPTPGRRRPWPRSGTPRTAARPPRRHRVQAAYGAKFAQGGREDHRRSRRAARVLRLPRRALDPPAHHQPDRVDLRHRPAPDQGHQGPRLARPPAWPWRSSSSRPPRPAGAPSTHPTSSPSSAPAPASKHGKLVEREPTPSPTKQPKDLHPQVLTIARRILTPGTVTLSRQSMRPARLSMRRGRQLASAAIHRPFMLTRAPHRQRFHVQVADKQCGSHKTSRSAAQTGHGVVGVLGTSHLLRCGLSPELERTMGRRSA